MIDSRLDKIVKKQPFPLLFATVSGAHLYGFPSPDSDYDLRGAHILPLPSVLGLTVRDETVENSGLFEGVEMDIVSHDVRKFFGLLLKKNGYVLEQLYSPLIVHSTPAFEELKDIARGCITRNHAHHYFGFAETQWKLLMKEEHKRVKPLLYVYRVLLTGIHLMKTGKIEANLPKLNQERNFSFINELIERKTSGPEKAKLQDQDFQFHEIQFKKLMMELESVQANSTLPEAPSETTHKALNDLLVRIRLM